jgi:hypothetical protein
LVARFEEQRERSGDVGDWLLCVGFLVCMFL